MRTSQTNSLLYASFSRYALQNIMQFQAPPALGNQYEDDSVLRSYLRRTIPADVRPTFKEMEQNCKRSAANTAAPQEKDIAAAAKDGSK